MVGNLNIEGRSLLNGKLGVKMILWKDDFVNGSFLVKLLYLCGNRLNYIKLFYLGWDGFDSGYEWFLGMEVFVFVLFLCISWFYLI